MTAVTDTGKPSDSGLGWSRRTKSIVSACARGLDLQITIYWLCEAQLAFTASATLLPRRRSHDSSILGSGTAQSVLAPVSVADSGRNGTTRSPVYPTVF